MSPRLTAPLAALLAACIQLPPALPPPCGPCDADSGAADAHDAAADAQEPDAHVADAPVPDVPDADAPDDAVTPDAHDADAPDATTGLPCPFGCEADVPVVVTALTAGDAHTCALTGDGRVFCWGSLAHGAVGLDLLRQGAAPPHAVPLPAPAAGVASGARHTCAWTVDGDLLCWGDDRLSQAGTASPGWRPAPAPVPLDEPVAAYVSGHLRGCAFGADAARCWGLTFGATPLTDLEGDAPHGPPSVDPALAGVTVLGLALGREHGCFITGGGAGVSCLGVNDRGQLGDGSLEGSATPVAVDADGLLAPVHALAAGARHTCAVVGEAALQVQCWGSHGRGAAAGPAAQPVTRPTLVDHAFDAPIDALALGDDTSCALSGGAVWCWGDNRHGQLGSPSPAQRATPAPVPGVAGATALAVGARHACALLDDLRVLCWGDGADGQRGEPPADPGGGHAPNEVRYDPALAARPACDAPGAAIDPDDDGAATCRQCAPEGATAGCAFRCGDDELCDPVAPGGLAAGTHHSCAALASGALFCWGDNERRQLGDGDGGAGAVRPPTRVPDLPGVAAVAAGAAHTCALRDTGAVTCWGDNSSGQVGVIGASGGAPAPPTLVVGIPPVAAIAARHDTTCAAAGARLWCWGSRFYAPTGSSFDKEPTELATVGVATIHAVALGRRHGCVLADRDSPGDVREVSCWGHNNADQLGRDSAGSVVVKPVPGVVGAALLALAATAHATCASDGERVLCWGGASTGALGPAADEPQPVDLGAHFDAEVVALAAGEGHLCAALADGRVACWGAGGDGQLGLDALPEVSPTPTLVPGVDGVVALTAGGAHTCALDADGLLVCWGAGGRGALGNAPWHPATPAQPAPIAVGAFSPYPSAPAP